VWVEDNKPKGAKFVFSLLIIMTQKLPAEIFKAYDIRGIYPEQINESNTELIGKAAGTVFFKKKLQNDCGRPGQP